MPFRLFLVLMAVVLVAPCAWAEEAYQLKSLTITPVEKCYAQIGAQAAEDVRRNYDRPYEECLRRLDEKLRQEQAEKAKGAMHPVEPAPPANFYRVQKTPLKTEKAVDK